MQSYMWELHCVENNFENYLKGNIFMAYNVGKTSEILKPKIIFYT